MINKPILTLRSFNIFARAFLMLPTPTLKSRMTERTVSSVSLFNSLKWVPFYAESYLNPCTITYKVLNGNTPEYIND